MAAPPAPPAALLEGDLEPKVLGYCPTTPVRLFGGGVTTIGQLSVGDRLVDEAGEPALVTWLGSTRPEAAFAVDHAVWDSHTARSTIIFGRDQPIALVEAKNAAYKNGRLMSFTTRCRDGGFGAEAAAEAVELRALSEEPIEVAMRVPADLLPAERVADEGQSDGSGEEMSGDSDDSNDSDDHDDDSDEDDDDSDEDDAEDGAPGSPAVAARRPPPPHQQRERRFALDDDVETVGEGDDEEAEVELEADGANDVAFRDASFSSDGSAYDPDAEIPMDVDLSDLSITSDLSESAVEAALPESARTAINEIHQKLGEATCDCGGYRNFTTPDVLADQVLLIKLAKHPQLASLLDPLALRAGQIVEGLTPAVINASRHKKRTLQVTRLYRLPLSVVGADAAGVDVHDVHHRTAYWLGRHAADGTIKITYSDAFFEAYMRRFVDDLNAQRPAGTRELAVRTEVANHAGDVCRSLSTAARVYIANVTVRRLQVVSSARGGRGERRWNPLRRALQQANIFQSKAAGVPAWIKEGTPSVRRQYIAGFIDGDGSLRHDPEPADGVKAQSATYFIEQQTLEHQQLFHDVLDLCRSLAIKVGRVLERSKVPPGERDTFKDGEYEHPSWRAHVTGEEVKKLGPFITIPHKRLPVEHRFNDTDLRLIKAVEDAGVRPIRALSVAGGRFVHESGTILAD